jgi:hypothetical protein
MEGEAPSLPAQGDSAGPTTTSALPIAPVYAGASPIYDFSGYLRSRRAEMMSDQFYKTPDLSAEYENPYVPHPMGPRGGIEIQRHMSGVGIPFMDPLDNFKPGRLEINKKSSPVRRPYRPIDTGRMRKKGAAAYRRANRENADYGQEM